MKLIRFYKWKNPLKTKIGGSDGLCDIDEEISKSAKLSIDTETKKKEKEKEKENDDEEEVSATKALGTPFGIIPIDNNWLIDTHIDFWIMDTNFNINEDIQNLIKNMGGVEVFNVYTRYKGRIGVPKKSGFFDAKVILNNIKDSISAYFRNAHINLVADLPEQIAKKAIETRDLLNAKHNYWGLLVLPNGNLEILTSDKNDKEYLQKLSVLGATVATVGGRLLLSE